MSKAKQSFADRLAELRAKNALSPTDLAKLANVSPAAVWQWEKNGTTPRSTTVSMIANKLGVTPDYLLNGSEAAVPVKALTETEVSESGSRRWLEHASLEELIRAIEAKGFCVSITSRF